MPFSPDAGPVRRWRRRSVGGDPGTTQTGRIPARGVTCRPSCAAAVVKTLKTISKSPSASLIRAFRWWLRRARRFILAALYLRGSGDGRDDSAARSKGSERETERASGERLRHPFLEKERAGGRGRRDGLLRDAVARVRSRHVHRLHRAAAPARAGRRRRAGAAGLRAGPEGPCSTQNRFLIYIRLRCRRLLWSALNQRDAVCACRPCARALLPPRVRTADTAQRAAPVREATVRPGRYCSPCHRMPFNSRNEGSNCASMTRRAASARL